MSKLIRCMLALSMVLVFSYASMANELITPKKSRNRGIRSGTGC